MISDQGQKSACASILPAAMFAAPTGGLWLTSVTLSDSPASRSTFSVMPQAALPTGVDRLLPARSASDCTGESLGTTMPLPVPLRL